METLFSYKKKYESLYKKCSLSGNEALKAVERNGDALRYVKEQMFIKIETKKASN
ncbi:MAG: hypothetical protein PHH77_10890 [Victivallaceae bacterium]|nr:hypothetical protein [Victivallaceae bacterium]